MSRRALKTALLTLCRAAGLFAWAQWRTRKELRILCYHGFSIGDQHEFEPILFMRPEVFERRLRVLERRNLPVVSLSRGIELLQSDAVRRAETVITIDDGWKTTLALAAPVLGKFRYPSCLYITTYYAQRPANVFNVACSYLLWRAPAIELDLAQIDPGLKGHLHTKRQAREIVAQLVSFANARLPWPERQQLLERLARSLGLNAAEALRERRFHLLDAAEIGQCGAFGIDVQLHTHRHVLPTSSLEALRREIDENRQLLEAWTGGNCRHLCYPSGQYAPQHPEWLAAAGVASATTCDQGLNRPDTSAFLLRRYLDRDDVADVEFEAEITGFAEVMRRARQSMTGLLR